MMESTHRIRCDASGCTRGGPVADTKDEAWTRAKDEGWYVDARKDLCPEHWPTLEEEDG